MLRARACIAALHAASWHPSPYQHFYTHYSGDGERDVEVCRPSEEPAGDEAGAGVRHDDKKRDCTHEGDAAAGGGILGAWGHMGMTCDGYHNLLFFIR